MAKTMDCQENTACGGYVYFTVDSSDMVVKTAFYRCNADAGRCYGCHGWQNMCPAYRNERIDEITNRISRTETNIQTSKEHLIELRIQKKEVQEDYLGYMDGHRRTKGTLAWLASQSRITDENYEIARNALDLVERERWEKKQAHINEINKEMEVARTELENIQEELEKLKEQLKIII